MFRNSIKYGVFAILFVILLSIGVSFAKRANIECSTGSTSCTVVSGSGTTNVAVHWFFLTLNADDNIALYCGATKVFGKHYLSARGGAAMEAEGLTYGRTILCGAGESFTLTKDTASTPVTIDVSYDQF